MKAALRCGMLFFWAVALVACSPPAPEPVEDTFPGQPVTHRQKAFKEILRQFEPIGLMLRGEMKFDAQRLLSHAEKLQAAAELPWSHFPPNSIYPPSKANDSIWQDEKVFANERRLFSDAVNSLLTEAKGGERERIVSAYAAVHESCRSCHKGFRR